MKKQEIDSQTQEMLQDIKDHMAKRKLTQDKMAELCGWKQPQVSAYLSGSREPGLRNIVKMAIAVGCQWRLKRG